MMACCSYAFLNGKTTRPPLAAQWGLCFYFLIVRMQQGCNLPNYLNG